MERDHLVSARLRDEPWREGTGGVRWKSLRGWQFQDGGRQSRRLRREMEWKQLVGAWCGNEQLLDRWHRASAGGIGNQSLRKCRLSRCEMGRKQLERAA